MYLLKLFIVIRNLKKIIFSIGCFCIEYRPMTYKPCLAVMECIMMLQYIPYVLNLILSP